MPKRIPEETKQRAIRLVLDHLDEYPNLTTACETVSKRLGFGAESLRRWVRQTCRARRRRLQEPERHRTPPLPHQQWRGLATRYDKHAVIYRAAVVLNAVIAWTKALSDTP